MLVRHGQQVLGSADLSQGEHSDTRRRQLTRRRRRLRRCVSFFFGLPLFVTVLGGGVVSLSIPLTDEAAGQVLPVSLFLLAVVVVLWIVRALTSGRLAIPGSRQHHAVKSLAVLLIAWNLIAFLLGQLSLYDFRSAPFVMQATFPVLALFVMLRMARDSKGLLDILTWMLCGIVTGMVIVVFINILTFGSGVIGREWVSHFGSFGVYQLYSYVPNMFATFAPIAVAIAIASRSRAHRYIAVTSLVLTLLVITHSRSITALAIAGGGLAVLFLLMTIHHLWRARPVHIVLAFVVLLMPLAIWRFAPLRSEVIYKTSPGLTKEDGGVSKRLKKYGEVAETVALSPVWGKAYRVDYGEGLGGLVGSRVTKPHNQYLDTAEKSGLLGLALFVALASLPIRAALSASRVTQQDKNLRVVGVALSAALLPSVTIHSLSLVPYVQSYSSIILWSLGGLAIRYADIAIHASHYKPDPQSTVA